MHHDHFLLLGEPECARKKFDVSAAGNVCELQTVLNGNENAPHVHLTCGRSCKCCNPEKDKKTLKVLSHCSAKFQLL